jgi:ABC-type oligopeptide transport system substrate-binding subunit
MFGWMADYPTPATFFDPIFSCSGRLPASQDNLNLSQLCSPALDRAVAAAADARGPAAEVAWAVAERRLAELAPAVPLTSRRQSHFYSARAGNVEQNPFLGVMLDRIWVR